MHIAELINVEHEGGRNKHLVGLVTKAYILVEIKELADFTDHI